MPRTCSMFTTMRSSEHKWRQGMVQLVVVLAREFRYHMAWQIGSGKSHRISMKLHMTGMHLS